MKKVISFAQKGLILDYSRYRILAIKYGVAKYTSERVSGKYGLPGGKLDFGEDVDESFIREVKEETGVIITPGRPFHVYTWIYRKENTQVQIVALARLGSQESGNINTTPKTEKESIIDRVQWVNLAELNAKDFTADEQPVIKKFLEYSKKISLANL